MMALTPPDVVRGSLDEKQVDADLMPEHIKADFELLATEDQGSIFMSDIYLVPDAIPDGVYLKPDGTVICVWDRASVHVAPAPKKPVDMAAKLLEFSYRPEADGALQIKKDGLLTMRLSEDSHVSAGFGYLIEEENAFSAASEEGARAGDIEFTVQGEPPYYTVTAHYSDGTTQNIVPHLETMNEVGALLDRAGITWQLDRMTGIIEVDTGEEVLYFRPDYFVDALTKEEMAWYEENRDESGLAFRVYDANGDGLEDVEVYSAAGKQMVYRIGD